MNKYKTIRNLTNLRGRLDSKIDTYITEQVLIGDAADKESIEYLQRSLIHDIEEYLGNLKCVCDN